MMPANSTLRAITFLKVICARTQTGTISFERQTLLAKIIFELEFSTRTSADSVLMFLIGSGIAMPEKKSGYTQIKFDLAKAHKFIKDKEFLFEN